VPRVVAPSGTPELTAVSRGAVPRALDRLRRAFFGPGTPLPAAAPPGTEPRRWDYDTGWNMHASRPRSSRDEELSAEQLRLLADRCELIRLAIETRKAQIARLTWTIQLRDPPAGQKPGALDPEAQAIAALFKKPDGQRRWKRWLKVGLEELLVLDALAIYRRPNRRGGVYGLDILDAGTIKPLIDERGNEPATGPAYQQIVKGLPATDFTRAELLYEMLTERVNRVYGCSPVQQINLLANLAIRRALGQLQAYTDGTVPESIYQAPKDWTTDMVREFQAYWDSLFEGDQAQLRRMRVIPGGDGAALHQTKAALLKDELDEWLARVVAYAFSLPPTWAVKMMNRATAEISEDAALEEGQLPLMDELADIFDELLARFFNRPDLCWKWQDPRRADPEKQARVHDVYLARGVIGPDEVREVLGLPPLGVPPMVYLPTGPVTWEDVQAGLLLPPAPPEPGAEPAALPAPGAAPDADPADAEDAGDEEADVPPAEKAAALTKAARLTVPTLPRAAARLRAGRTRNAAPVRAAVRVLAGEIAAGFAATVSALVAQIGGRIEQAATGALQKADAATDLLTRLDLGQLAVVEGPLERALALVAGRGATEAVATLRLAVPSLEDFAIPNERVTDFARERAAELVGKRVLADGTVIDSPNPEFAITEATRTLLRGTISTALEEGWSREQLREVLTGSYAFSAQRALTIARTELSRALIAGNMAAWQASGAVAGKQWILGSLHDLDDECDGNAADGVVGFGDSFSSGDSAPPAHPRCVCDVIPILTEEEDAGG
jgi:hypothetical protein